jgi:hypothetical protein
MLTTHGTDRRPVRRLTSDRYVFDYVWGELLMADSGLFHARAEILANGEVIAFGQTDLRPLADPE